MKKKINIQFLIITLLAILTTVSLSIFVFYELFKQEVMADLKTNTQLLVENGCVGADCGKEGCRGF